MTMTLRKRILVGLLALVLLALATLAVALSYESPCPAPAPPPAGGTPMQAVVHRCYGTADVLHLETIARPTPKDNEILVKVHAASVNPLDVHSTTGKPYIMRLSSGLGAPDNPRLGVDFAGTVEAVGTQVTRFNPGDAVFGGRNGALADYLVVREDRAVVPKPSNLSFEQAAALPIAAVTALQGLRDHGHLRPGQKVLINGASGGVGTVAVQIAKAYGAEVTGVCSTRNLDLVRSLGADHVIDYTQENFTEGGAQYDLILDNVGSHSLLDTRRALKPDGILVIVSGPKRDPWLGPLARVIQAALLAPFVDQEMTKFLAELTPADLAVLADLAQAGKLTPVIDRRYPLREAAEAIRYVETGRARGKVIVEMN